MGEWNLWNSKNDLFKKTEGIKSNLIIGDLNCSESDISIILLTYNRAHTLKRSLASAMKQKYNKGYKIIVLDDYPYDDVKTYNIVKEANDKNKNISYVKNEKNLGQYNAWNRAIKICPTKWFCLLHDDDMIEENYLAVMEKTIKEYGEDVGMIGSYFHVLDERKNVKSGLYRKTIDTFVDMFIKIRRGRPIEIGIKENLKLIYPLSCCLMINTELVKDIGGLDDSYYPSSDFVVDSKMAYYHKTLFLPQFLSIRGIAENESLKMEVCTGAIECAYHHTMAMCQTLGINEKKSKNKASFAAMCAEFGVRGYHDVDYGKTKEKLGMLPIYNNRFVLIIAELISKINWGLLLFK